LAGAGGSLLGDQTLYYAISAVDAVGGESALSFIVRATIPSGTNTNSVILTGLSFAPGTMSFHVYRGPNPAQLYRIATAQSVADRFVDNGLSRQLVAPPDAAFDHANFYWRLELQPAYSATIHSDRTAGNDFAE